MKFFCLCLLGITAFLEVLLPVLANQKDFLSINCGASEDDPGGDDLLWVSDSPFVKAKSRNSSTLPNGDSYFPFRTISYFTDVSQKKYCYLLPVKPDNRILLRTRFDNRFQSELSLATVFDLLVGGVKWTTLDFTNSSVLTHFEIILASKSDRLSLCLARNSDTKPDHYVFISTIELRPLHPSMYTRENVDFYNSALVSIKRINFGGEAIYYRRTRSDEYDRIWSSYEPEINMDSLNISAPLGTDLLNNVPPIVLQTAVSAKKIEEMDISDAFVNFYISLSPGSYYCLFYFCNINRSATSGTTNTFKVLINKQQTDWLEFKDLLQLKHLDPITNLTTDATNIRIVLSPLSNNSASKPFINAAELYKILAVQNTQLEDVLAIREIADAINVPDDWSGDPCLPSGYSSTGITCSEENPPRVIVINLTNMSLHGNIPPSIAKLTALTQLLLGNNNLSGPIPDLSSLKNLTKLYLKNNSLTGTVPRGLVKRGLVIEVDPEIKFPAHERKFWPIGISIGCSVLLIIFVTCSAFIWRHRHRSQPYTKDSPTCNAQHASPDVKNQSEYRTLAIEYTEDDIKAATKNYSRVIGKGSFGSVFYGRFSGSDVAVKVLSTDSNQGQVEFHNELTVLSRIHHRNLVNLVGYCKQPVVALVYEYMECGSLKDHLFGLAKLENPLDWQTRLNIALQAAEGLLYLHRGCNPPIIHRDIKCNNILLDGNMCAKVADFGLSKALETSESYVSTIVKGTIGYLDPEYLETSALTKESDVYSFGVVLLEILSGVSPRDGIVESGRKLLSCGRMVDLIDTSLGGRYNLSSAWRVAEIAYSCTEPKSIKRPKMNVVVKELEEAAALGEEDVGVYGSFSITTSIQGDLPSLR